MGCESLIQHRSLPFGDRDLLAVCGDAIPQGLYVLDLLVYRKIVEARGRKPEGFSHDQASIRHGWQ